MNCEEETLAVAWYQVFRAAFLIGYAEIDLSFFGENPQPRVKNERARLAMALRLVCHFASGAAGLSFLEWNL